MIGKFMRTMRFLVKSRFADSNSVSKKHKTEPLSNDLETSLTKMRQIFGGSTDVVVREFTIGLNKDVDAALIYVDGLVEKTMISQSIMKPLMLEVRVADPASAWTKKEWFAAVKKNALTMSEVREVKTYEETVDWVLSGDTILLIDGYKVALVMSTRGWESRGVSEPHTEVVVRGPREGFTETLRTNTSLLRRKIKSPNLVFESMKFGRVTKTDICIAYIRGIADDKVVEELKKRLSRIDIDGILESGYIEEFIEDSPFSIFPTIGNSEKPDIVAAKLLEGRVVVITDGTPMVLTLPQLFIEALQAGEDYYSRPWLTSIVRVLRVGALIITVGLPALYVAAQTYHYEMIPTELLISMAAAHEGIPFPAFIEILIMSIVFEGLREAGVRMPRPVGQAISIVGALVLGEIAVSAGLVGAPAVMATAMAGLAAFVLPSQTGSITILRFAFLVLAAVAGLFGVLIGYVFVMCHMVGLRSFGVPYLSPIAPSTISDQKDVIFRAPLWAMYTRPRVLGHTNPVRLDPTEPDSSHSEEKKSE